MSIADLIQKRRTLEPANAKAANPANNAQAKGGQLATLAALALANPSEAKTANLPEPATDARFDPNLPHWAWRLTYPDGSTQEKFTLPEATHAEILKLWPEVIAAEPFDPVTSETVPVTPQDQQDFEEVMQQDGFDGKEIELARQAYQNDPAAGKRTYAALRAEFHSDTEAPAAGVMSDKRRTCNECANLDPEGHCRAATGLGASRHYRPIQDQPRHCEAFQPSPGEPATHERSLERLGDLALAQESRRLKVLAMLDVDPTLRSAYVVDSDIDPEQVFVTLAARDWITCDIAIPRAKFDPFQVLALMADLRPLSKTVH